MNSMADALSKAGVKVPSNVKRRFDCAEDVKYPFYVADLLVFPESSLLSDMNYFLSDALPLGIQAFTTTYKPVFFDPIYKWIMNNMEKCRDDSYSLKRDTVRSPRKECK